VGQQARDAGHEELEQHRADRGLAALELRLDGIISHESASRERVQDWGVFDVQRLVAEDRMRAEREIPRRLVTCEARARLEPLVMAATGPARRVQEDRLLPSPESLPCPFTR
jgi:hypothetical protein